MLIEILFFHFIHKKCNTNFYLNTIYEWNDAITNVLLYL